MAEKTEIFLSETAFMSIILSSIEVFKKECLGILLGIRSKDNIIVNHAIPFQAVKLRTYSEVQAN